MRSLNNSDLNSKIIPFNPIENNNSRNQQQSRNIFATNSFQLPKDTFEKSHKRLNDTDTNMLNKNLTQYIPSDSLRLELKIQNAEASLKEVKKDLRGLKLIGLDKDKEKLLKLTMQKKHIEKEIYKYRTQYRQLGFVFKIADIFSEFYSKASDKLTEVKYHMTNNNLLRKISDKVPVFKKRNDIKDILEKINTVNSRAANIFANKSTPWGENNLNYNDVSILMTKANKYEVQSNKFLSLTKVDNKNMDEPITSATGKILKYSRLGIESALKVRK